MRPQGLNPRSSPNVESSAASRATVSEIASAVEKMRLQADKNGILPNTNKASSSSNKVKPVDDYQTKLSRDDPMEYLREVFRSDSKYELRRKIDPKWAYFGFAAALITMVSIIIQIAVIVQRQSAEDISYYFIIGLGIVQVLTIIYGIKLRLWVSQISGFVGLIVVFIFLYLKMKYDDDADKTTATATAAL